MRAGIDRTMAAPDPIKGVNPGVPCRLVWNGLEIVKGIAESAHAVVFEVTAQHEPGSTYVLKRTTRVAQERLGREIEALAKLATTGVTKSKIRYTIPMLRASGDDWLLLERGPTQTLRSWIETTPEAQRGWAEVQRIGVALLHLVKHIHEKYWIHRDIKPTNILVEQAEDGSVSAIWLIDFGLARCTKSGHDSSPRDLTMENMPLGTMRYAAPEQLENGRSADAASDIFSVGLVLFECLAGGHPFTETEPASVEEMRALYRGALPPIEDKWLSRLFQQLLRESSRERSRRPEPDRRQKGWSADEALREVAKLSESLVFSLAENADEEAASDAPQRANQAQEPEPRPAEEDREDVETKPQPHTDSPQDVRSPEKPAAVEPVIAAHAVSEQEGPALNGERPSALSPATISASTPVEKPAPPLQKRPNMSVWGLVALVTAALSLTWIIAGRSSSQAHVANPPQISASAPKASAAPTATTAAAASANPPRTPPDASVDASDDSPSDAPPHSPQAPTQRTKPPAPRKAPGSQPATAATEKIVNVLPPTFLP